MRGQIAAALCAAALCLAALGVVALSSLAIARDATTDRQAYSTIKDLMESIIDPSADAIWGAVGTVVDEQGTHESLPKSPSGVFIKDCIAFVT
jgi:hypothetical protein